MKSIWSILGGGLGWAVGGPIGAIVGATIGAAIDSASGDKSRDLPPHQNTTATDFHVSLLILAAEVIKADGVKDQRELDHVRNSFVTMFGAEKANASFRIFNDLLKKEVPLIEVCTQIRLNMPIAGRRQLLHFLYSIAASDGHIHPKEIELIDRIAAYLQIESVDANSLKAMFNQSSDSDYKILEVHPEASAEEIKRSYRNLAKKYHPDRVDGMGEDVKKAAEEKFRTLKEAYDRVMAKKK